MFKLGFPVARRQARELAFRTLFQAERGNMSLLDVWQQMRDDFAAQSDEDIVEEVLGPRLESEDIAFADRLVRTYAQHQTHVDDQLERALEGWTFSQMSQTDLNVLRLALTELLYEKDVAKEVTIEIAIRIAKKYGGEESGRFVNGVLARALRQHPNKVLLDTSKDAVSADETLTAAADAPTEVSSG